MSFTDELETKLNKFFTENADTEGVPNISVELREKVLGHENGKPVYRDEIIVSMPQDFLQANMAENAGLSNDIHTKAAEELRAMGYNPKLYRPVLCSRIA